MNETDAYSIMAARLRSAIDAHAIAILGYKPEVRYEAQVTKDAPNSGKVWLSFGVRFEGSRRTSMGRVANYTTTGEMWCEMYSPVNDDAALGKALALASVIRDEYRKPETSQPLRFRETNIRTLLSSLLWNTRRVSVSFEFDERR